MPILGRADISARCRLRHRCLQLLCGRGIASTNDHFLWRGSITSWIRPLKISKTSVRCSILSLFSPSQRTQVPLSLYKSTPTHNSHDLPSGIFKLSIESLQIFIRAESMRSRLVLRVFFASSKTEPLYISRKFSAYEDVTVTQLRSFRFRKPRRQYQH